MKSDKPLDARPKLSPADDAEIRDAVERARAQALADFEERVAPLTLRELREHCDDPIARTALDGLLWKIAAASADAPWALGTKGGRSRWNAHPTYALALGIMKTEFCDTGMWRKLSCK